MNKIAVYDVLIVYTDAVATSASSNLSSSVRPFLKNSGSESYNECYAYFLKVCKRKNIKAAFTTTKDIDENGYFKTHWVFSRNRWIKNKYKCYAHLIFDKFSPINKIQQDRHSNLFAIDGIEPFNSLGISTIFTDKQKTHEALGKFTIPTVTLKDDSVQSIKQAVKKLKKLVEDHPESADFSKRIVIKDRFGAGGNNIFCTKKDNRKVLIKKIVSENKGISFILQPFANFSEGYKENDRNGFVDVRIIYLGSKLIQCYIRTAAKGDFRCNMHQGGDIEYITKKEIPLKVERMAREILSAIDNSRSLLALDFIVSNKGNVYLMEGNSHPGIIWDNAIKNDMAQTKRLIIEIVKELSERIGVKTTKGMDGHFGSYTVKPKSNFITA